MKELIAVLDEKQRLVGIRRGKADENDVVLPENTDLPTDGSYIHRDGAFWPGGHGFPKPLLRSPVTEQLALYHLIRTLGLDAHQYCLEWADWYEANFLQRDEEQAENNLRAKGVIR